MPLLLQIENIDRLADGGPISMAVTRHLCQVGRNISMDWVLPDPSRMISGHHFDVHFEGNSWWLTDRSTNGTFLLGSPYRLTQPHRLAHMDRIQVGKYVVLIRMEEATPAQPQANPQAASPYAGQALPAAPMPGSWQGEAEDPWAIGAALPPLDLRPGPGSGANRKLAADFGSDFIPTPSAAAQPHAPPIANLGGSANPAAPLAQGLTSLPGVSLPPLHGDNRTGIPNPAHPPAAAPPPGTTSGHAVQIDTAQPAMPADFVSAFCAAAGLDTKLADGLDPAAFGQMLGEILRGTTEELMTQLKLRAAARKFTRSADQTMRRAQANNPLKFLPGPEQALESILFRPRAGFLSGASAVNGALGDLRQHQVAIFAALQPALMRLLEDLSPDAIEAASGEKGFLAGARKQRAWETYVQNWDAKAHAHENGMLDAFLTLFAESYDEALSKQRSEAGE